MIKQALHSLLFSFLLTFTAHVSAQDAVNDDTDVRYVTDDLITYLHAGPGRNYRILGSLLAGAKVIQLQIDSDNGFVEVIDDRQRTGWVDAKFISDKMSVRALVPALQQRVESANSQLTEQLNINERLNQQIDELTRQSSALNAEVQSLQQTNTELRKELANNGQSAQMQWLLRGGGIALVSVLLGIMVTYLPKKKRRNDQWM